MKNNRKAVDERHMKILNMIRERGEVKVEDLAKIFQISPMTVRRDMQYLEEEKLISRIHGGLFRWKKRICCFRRMRRSPYAGNGYRNMLPGLLMTETHCSLTEAGRLSIC